MKKYWYYVFKISDKIQFNIATSDGGEFPLFSEKTILDEKYKESVIINWKEISQREYEKLKNNFDNK